MTGIHMRGFSATTPLSSGLTTRTLSDGRAPLADPATVEQARKAAGQGAASQVGPASKFTPAEEAFFRNELERAYIKGFEDGRKHTKAPRPSRPGKRARRRAKGTKR